jgi:hypothetical protein
LPQGSAPYLRRGPRFPPTAAPSGGREDLARATAWLEAQGFTVHGASSTGTRLFFSGNAGQVERAFHAELHRYDIAGEKHFAPFLSTSWGGCEYSMTPADLPFYEALGDAAAMQGITLLSAQGDWGAADCDYQGPAAVYGLQVDWPGSMPSVVAVGGTEFDWGDAIPEQAITPAVASAAPFSTYWSCDPSASSCRAKGYVPETGWNELAWELSDQGYFWGASGGGVSQVFPKPLWQVGQTPRGTTRQLPDLALNAAWSQVGYMMTYTGTEAGSPPQQLQVTGGTSAAAPSFAGILAVLNQAIAATHLGAPVGLGNANPLLYALNSSTQGTSRAVFHDITTGSNIVPCQPGSQDCPANPPYQIGYQATPGFDLVPGLGSLDVKNLVSAAIELSTSFTTLEVTPSKTTEGAPVQVSATVLSTGPTRLNGTVLFYVDTVDAKGLADTSLMATAPIVPLSAFGLFQGAKATASLPIPPGQFGRAKVLAFYTGDARTLSSYSRQIRVTSTSTLAVTPANPTVPALGTLPITLSGGVPPISWEYIRDTSCDAQYDCSYFYQTTSGVFFVAGGQAGQSTFEAVDALGASARLTVNVVAPPPADAGTP